MRPLLAKQETCQQKGSRSARSMCLIYAVFGEILFCLAVSSAKPALLSDRGGEPGCGLRALPAGREA